MQPLRIHQGFSLVELMLVVAIIGIGAAIALPSYQNYVLRTRVSEGILAASACRTTVAERYQSGSPSAPPGVNGWGCESTQPTKYIESVTTDANGVVTVFLSTAVELAGARHHTFTLTPLTAAGLPLTVADMPTQVTQFKCQSGGFLPIPPKYLPSSCK